MGKKYILGNGATLNTQNGSTEFKIAGSTGLLYSQEKPVFMPASTVFNPYYVETLTASSGGVTPSTATAYGVTLINCAAGDLSTSPRLITLAAPITGVEKTIVFGSTAAYINTLDVDLGGDAGVAHITGSTTARFIAFSSLATEYQTVTLVGLSTALWGVKSVDSTVGGFGVATGIRSATAARTS
jgi:hypothetical protein